VVKTDTPTALNNLGQPRSNPPDGSQNTRRPTAGGHDAAGTSREAHAPGETVDVSRARELYARTQDAVRQPPFDPIQSAQEAAERAARLLEQLTKEPNQALDAQANGLPRHLVQLV
jgi:hypothetical protein